MMTVRFEFAARTPQEFVETLHRTRIAVPRITAGRTAQHRERYTMARFLATAYVQSELTFPLMLEHRDNTANPDFVIHMPSGCVGVECVEAVPNQWYEIQAIRERLYPGAMVFLPKLRPQDRSLSAELKHAIASGEYAGEPWMGDEPERDWASAHRHFISNKVRKLRSGNYRPLSRIWLLVQDEWTVPIGTDTERLHALDMLLPELVHEFHEPSFERVYIGSSPFRFELSAAGVDVKPLENWWQ